MVRWVVSNERSARQYELAVEALGARPERRATLDGLCEVSAELPASYAPAIRELLLNDKLPPCNLTHDLVEAKRQQIFQSAPDP